MPRKPTTPPVDVIDGASSTVIASKGRALELHAGHSADIAALFGDGQPYERERIIGMARTYMAASAEAMLEAGKCLIQLKENEPHGEFIDIVESRLGVGRRTAQVMMQAAARFLAPALSSKAQAPALLGLGKTKLIELLAEPDDALEALADGGTLAGKSLDDMQAMTSRELRAALLEERRKLAAKDKVIAKKDAKLNELAEREEMRRNGTPDEREAAQLADLRDVGLEAEHALLRLVTIVDEAMRTPATEAAELAARQTIEYVAQRFTDALLAREIAVDLLGERIDPDWAKGLETASRKTRKAA